MNYYLLFITSFITSTISIYFLRKFAIKYNFYDEPGENKIHQKSIPYFGGIGIFLGFCVGLIFFCLFRQILWLQVIGFIISGLMFFLIGLFDDLKWKKTGHNFLKLFIQFLVGFLIIFIFIKIGIIFHLPVDHFLIFLMATLYIVGIINAINVNDGIDGLTGSIVGISLIGFIILAFISGNLFILIISVSLLAGIIGFLFYNWYPASIFMGDNGSHFLGFSLATIAIIISGHPVFNFKQFIGPLLIVGFPIIDMSITIIRRMINGKSPFAKGRNYLYDQIHFKLGFSITETVLTCCLFQFILVVIGILIYSL